MKLPKAKWLALLMIVVLLTSGLAANATQAKEPRVYTVGVVPQFDSRRILAIWRPILDALEQRSGIQFRLVGSASIPIFEQEFQSGKFDFAYMNPYHMLIAHNSQGYRPLLRDHSNQLQGILVVRKDSLITELSQLQGQYIAFPAPNALGASLMIRAELQERLDLKPRYVKSHTSVYLNVITGTVVAGGGVEKTLSQQSEEIREQLRIIYRTAGVATHPIAVHPRVSRRVAEQVQQMILDIAETEKGKEMLMQIPMKQVGITTADDYIPLKKMGLEPFYVKE